ALVRRPVQVAVGQQERQQQIRAALPQRVQELARIRLGADRIVGRDGAGHAHLGHLQQRVAQGPPGGLPVRRGQVAASRQQPRPEIRLLGHRYTVPRGCRRLRDRVCGMAVTKAVIPAAGLGTRFLPATKATPKEMLPVVDKPAIQYVVEEAVGSGLHDVLLITGRSKRSIEDHFDRAYELEEALAAKDETERLALVRESSELAHVHYVRQGDPKGLGHAVLCAAQHVGNEPFAVVLGDDMIDARDPLLTQMIDVRQRYGGSVVALMEVDPEQVSQYGCAAITPTSDSDVVAVTDLVAKPVPGSAPSRWIIIGRYVCDPAVFEVLQNTPPGRGGEIQLTDALKTLAKMSPEEGGGVHGILFRGRRYDTGNKLDYIRTLVQFACERSDLAQEIVPWLRKYLDTLQ